MADEYTPTTDEVRTHWWIAVDYHRREERLAEFDRMIAEVERAAAARALEEFAQAQDSWCEQGRAEQVISRAAMREALRARAEAYRQERGEQ